MMSQEAEELRRTIDCLQARERRKDLFLGQLGHELGNLMVPMQLAVQLLQGIEEVHPMVREVREILEGQGPEINRLLTNLRVASRLSRGFELHPEPVDLQSITRLAVAEVRPLMQERQQMLQLSLPDEPLTLACDRSWLQQVVAQLLSNAAEYSPPETSIALDAHREGEHVFLRVRDEGPGLPEELLPELFEAFVRGPKEFGWSGGHLGVGLAFARRVVELHQGAIEARNGEVGAEFIVRLPAG